MIGLYGYDTKDFIVNGHDRYDSSGNGVISRSDGDLPKGAYVVGTEHAYFTTITDNPGSWAVKCDLSEWASLISDGTVKRIEIAVLSAVDDADGEEVAINAVSKTFDIASNDFDDYFDPIVKVEDGCNNCHEALGTTFHSPDYGGDVTVCRMCHVSLVGGSHLEMQSRAIDSYVHAIHSMQYFDPGDVDFTDPVQALEYEDHTELFPYPTHGITDCESCHNEGMYNVPDQTKSLPAVLSASDSVDDRELSVPSYITGPASRACGGCHRAVMINEGATSELMSFFSHTRTGGYLMESSSTTIDTVIDEIMAYFK
jgi:OmcA/MtrC family decaheme c-type cytochrome